MKISITFAAISLSTLILPADDLSRQTHPVVAEKELLIIDPAVVDSPLATYPGAWSFGHLIEQLAEKDSHSAFVRDWLATWEKSVSVNGQTLPARNKITELVIKPWMAKDGFTGIPGEEWQVNLANAPFRLLAIVNRIDTGAYVQVAGRTVSFGSSNGVARYYGPMNFGEARFVYGVNDPHGEPLEGGFTVIFEYNLPAPDSRIGGTGGAEKRSTKLERMLGHRSDDDKAAEQERAALLLSQRLAGARYAARWHALGEHLAFDEAYLCELSQLTLEITERGEKSEPPSLAQLRTNEGALGEIQEAREYDYVNNNLRLAPVAATPAIAFQQTDDSLFSEHSALTKALAKYINANQRAILTNTHRIPLKIAVADHSRKPLPFLAASALMPGDKETGKTSFRWRADGVRYSEAMRHFSLNTCSGCHCGETATQFYHIHPRRAGEASQLSAFLRFDDSDLKIKGHGQRKRTVQMNEMHERRVIFETILNPGYDERDVLERMRRRSRRGH